MVKSHQAKAECHSRRSRRSRRRSRGRWSQRRRSSRVRRSKSSRGSSRRIRIEPPHHRGDRETDRETVCVCPRGLSVCERARGREEKKSDKERVREAGRLRERDRERS